MRTYALGRSVPMRNARACLAKTMSRCSTRPLMLPSGNRPVLSRLPAGMPVSTSIPSSIVFDCEDVKPSRLDGFDDIIAQHRMACGRGGNHHRLFSSEPAGPTNIEIAFDLFVDPTDGLDSPVLVDRFCDGDRLVVPMAAHAHATLNRDDRTVLAQYQRAVGQLCGRRKRQLRIATLAQLRASSVAAWALIGGSTIVTARCAPRID